MIKIGAFMAATVAATQTEALVQGPVNLAADLSSTETQLKKENSVINHHNKNIGKLRGALKLLGGQNKTLATQISKDQAALKVISIKYAAAEKMHKSRAGKLSVQQARLVKGRANLAALRREAKDYRIKLQMMNRYIKKATAYVKHETAKAKAAVVPHSIAKAKKALKKEQKKTAKIMKHATHKKHKAVKKHQSAVHKYKTKMLKQQAKKAKRELKKAKKIAKKAAKKHTKHAAAKKHAHKKAAKKAKKASKAKKAAKKGKKSHHKKVLAQEEEGSDSDDDSAKVNDLINSI